MPINYEREITIDPLNLPDEFLKQANLYLYCCKELADAQLDRDKKKEELDIIKAELDIRIRRDPDSLKLPKVTESVISSAIILQPDYKEANQKYLEKKHTVDVLSGAVKAFEHKKKSLEKLAELQIAGFFSSPKEPKQEMINNQSSTRRRRSRNDETK